MARGNPHIINGFNMTTLGFRNPGLVSMYNVLVWLAAMYCFGTMIYTANTVAKGAPEPKSGNRPVWVLLCPIVLGLNLLYLGMNGLSTGGGYRAKLNYWRLTTFQLGWQIIWMGFTCAVAAVTIWNNFQDGCFNHTQTDNSLCIGAPAAGPICALAGLAWIVIVILHIYLHITEQNYQQSKRIELIEAQNARLLQATLFQAQQRTSQPPLAHVAAEPVEKV